MNDVFYFLDIVVAKKCTKFDKVVKREICSIQTKGTKRYSFIDGDASSSESNYLLAICEKVSYYEADGDVVESLPFT